jgi:tetratricopeptide (TPR) repeat protein
MRLGKFAEAATIYKRALQADPKLVPLYYKIARAEHEAVGRARALPWYERAAREEPRNPMPHYYLGFAYKERGQRARAIGAFRAYLEAKPDAEDRKDIEREIEDLGGKL